METETIVSFPSSDILTAKIDGMLFPCGIMKSADIMMTADAIIEVTRVSLYRNTRFLLIFFKILKSLEGVHR